MIFGDDEEDDDFYSNEIDEIADYEDSWGNDSFIDDG